MLRGRAACPIRWQPREGDDVVQHLGTQFMREEDEVVLDSKAWDALYAAHMRAIRRIENPPGSGALTLRRPGGPGGANDPAWLRARFVQSMVGDEGFAPVMDAPAGLDIVVASGDGEVTGFACWPGSGEALRQAVGAIAGGLQEGWLRVGLVILPSASLLPLLAVADECGTGAAMAAWGEVGDAVTQGSFGISIVEQDGVTDDPAVATLRLS